MDAGTRVRQEAPGRLEVVRRLLNTWEIPGDRRVPTDRLPALAGDPRGWASSFPGARRPTGVDLRELTALRDGLRAAVEARELDGAWLRRWIASTGVGVAVEDHGAGPAIRHAPRDPGRLEGQVVAAVVDAVADGTWGRLTACPDCRWVSYDWTRNRSKVWCRPYAGDPSRRACGSIAKVRRYRERLRADA